MLSISMPNILVFIDDAMARALEKVAPARSRERSRFIRLAIRKALMELEDIETVKAYDRLPQDTPDSISLGEWDQFMPPEVRKAAQAARRGAKAPTKATKATTTTKTTKAKRSAGRARR